VANPTLRNDLPELIRHDRINGQITGLNTNAAAWRDEKYLQQLVDAGLDHVQITLESCDPQIHDQMVGGKGCLYSDRSRSQERPSPVPLYVMTNTTMLKTNAHKIPDTLDLLAELGVADRWLETPSSIQAMG